MVKKRLTLKELQTAVASEKKKAKTAQEIMLLERELKELRAGSNQKLLKRLGRGFVVLTKKGAKVTGRGIRAVNKFAEESGAGSGLKGIDLASGASKKTRVARARPRLKRGRVTTVIRTKRVIRGRRRVPKRTPPRDDFFGALNI